MSIIKEYREEIVALQTKIAKIQDKCNHPKEATTKKHGSNTGNYDPSADCYWTDFHCKLCDKQWTEDGSK